MSLSEHGSPLTRESLVVRRAEVADCAKLTEIAHAAKRFWGYPERWMDLWRDSLTITPSFVTGNDVFMATLAQNIVGFYGLVRGPLCWQLEHLWVCPEAMGEGVGRVLFEHAAARACAANAVSLEIDADPNAEGFYRRMGALKIGEAAGGLDGQRRVRPLLRLPLQPTGPL